MMKRSLLILSLFAASLLPGCRKSVPPPAEETEASPPPQEDERDGLEDMPDDGQGIIRF